MKKIAVPSESRTAELEVKKSRFIARAEYFDNPRSVKEVVKQLREEHEGCRHVVYAFFTGDDRSQSGLSDDGEPHGTAGRPVYEVLKGSGLSYILLTVVRYFGGTKLGTGGLVSAYGDAAKLVLEDLPFHWKIEKSSCTLEYDYKYHDSLLLLLEEVEGEIINQDFSTKITLDLEIPRDRSEELTKRIKDLTRGEIIPRFKEEE